MINRLTAIVAFIFLLSVAPNASAALCTGDSVGQRQLYFVPVGGQIGINYTVDLNHTPNHPTCFGSMNAFAFSSTGCDTGWHSKPHTNQGDQPSAQSYNSVTAFAVCNIPCGEYFGLGGNWDWNGGDGVGDQRLNQRYACDCQPWPPGPPQEGCVWDQYECDWVQCCPLVFDMSGRGYRLTSADRASGLTSTLTVPRMRSPGQTLQRMSPFSRLTETATGR